MLELTSLSFQNVLLFVPPKQIWSMKRVCKRFKKEADDPNLWKLLMKIKDPCVPVAEKKDCEQAMRDMWRFPGTRLGELEFRVIYGKDLIYSYREGKEKYTITKTFANDMKNFLLLQIVEPNLPKPFTLYAIHTKSNKRTYRKIALYLDDHCRDGDFMEFSGNYFTICVDGIEDKHITFSITVFHDNDCYNLAVADGFANAAFKSLKF